LHYHISSFAGLSMALSIQWLEFQMLIGCSLRLAQVRWPVCSPSPAGWAMATLAMAGS
jgi:hypothetical protein